MQIRIVAVGQRITEWAQSAVSDYLSRFPRDFRVELREIRTEPRAGQTPARLMAAEAERILAAIEPDSHWRADGETPVFVIGGPDGLAPEVKARANLTIRLSSMTLPHAFARVMLSEQIYRAWSILAGHPYHRA